jgi:hypothetical protein
VAVKEICKALKERIVNACAGRLRVVAVEYTFSEQPLRTDRRSKYFMARYEVHLGLSIA